MCCHVFPPFQLPLKGVLTNDTNSIDGQRLAGSFSARDRLHSLSCLQIHANVSPLLRRALVEEQRQPAVRGSPSHLLWPPTLQTAELFMNPFLNLCHLQPVI